MVDVAKRTQQSTDDLRDMPQWTVDPESIKAEHRQTQAALSWEASVNAAIAKLSEALISPASLEETAGLVLEEAKRLTGSRFGYVGYIDPATGALICPTFTDDIWDVCQVPDKDIVFETFGGLWGWVLDNGQTLLTNAPADDPRSSGTPPGHLPIRRFLSAPALVGDKLVGQIALANSDSDYTERDRALVERLASLYALAVERKQAEDALRESESRYSSLFSNNHAVMLLIDPTTADIIDANPAACAFYGYSKSALTGKKITDINTLSQQQIFEEMEAARAAQRQHFFFRHRLASGEIRDVEVYSGPIEMHGQRLLYSIIHDITRRKRMEDALNRRNLELSLLNRLGQELAASLDQRQVTEQLLNAVTAVVGAEGASVWLWEDEGEQRLVCWAASHQNTEQSPVDLRLDPNQGIAGWVAQKGESVVVPYAPEDERFFPGADEQTGSHTTSLLAVPLSVRGKVIGTLEVINKLHAASTADQRATKKEHVDFDAEDLALVETLAASAAIAIDNARLVEALRQHTLELETRNEELDAFAHTAAHDLKGPLGPVVGFAKLLEQDHASLSEGTLERSLGTIVRNARQMNNIIDELLLLAGVRKMEEIDLAPLDMGAIVLKAQQRLGYMLEEHGAQVTLPERWPVAVGYGPWIEEVWVNYLSNAIKYGGRPPRIEIGAQEQANGTLRFWMRDNGSGLTPEEQARLFTPFTRLDAVRAKGHGLGLSIVRRIVEKLGGQVGVESEKGRGSVFSFTLPTTKV